MTHRPLMTLILALAAGILAANVYPVHSAVALAIAAVALTAAGVGLWKAWRYNARVFFCAFLLLGFALTQIQFSIVQTSLLSFKDKAVKITGQVIDRPDVRFDGVFYKVQVSEVTHNNRTQPAGGVLRVKIRGQERVFQYGDWLTFSGVLRIPDPPGNPGAFDYRSWLTRQGITGIVNVKSPREVTVLGNQGRSLRQGAFGIRDRLEQIFDRTMTQTQAAVLKGMIFGTRGEIPPEVDAAFVESGLVHILSVSGFHIGLVAGLVLILLRIFRINKGFHAPVAIPLLLFYAVMTGMGPAVARSTFMAILLLLAHHFGREQDWPTTLAAAAGILLILNPLTLFDIGFQLSFLATWGLLYLTPVLTAGIPRLPQPLSLLVMVPLAAQLATLPLVVFYFNLVSPVSILANVLTTHLIALIMFFGGVSLLLGSLYLPLAAVTAGGTGLLTDFFLKLVAWCTSIPGAAFYIPAPSLGGILLYYALLIAGVELLRRPQWQAGLKEMLFYNGTKVLRKRAIMAGAVLIFVLFLWLLWPHSQRLEVHFIDVGQGDSALIITPDRRTMLVDAGGWREELTTGRGAGHYVVLPYLHRLGINKLDTLVITHPHEDHAGGAKALIRSMEVGAALVSPYGLEQEDKADQGYDLLLQDMKDRGIKIYPVREGNALNIDPAVTVRVISPGELFKNTRSDANNNSLVLLLNFRGRTVLLTGDTEVEAEEHILRENKNLQAEILKVPHHGSGYFYPEFFSSIRPRAAVISAGANNSFGHPAPNTLKALEEIHCPVYRTDLDGAVIFSTDGEKWQVITGK